MERKKTVKTATKADKRDMKTQDKKTKVKDGHQTRRTLHGARQKLETCNVDKNAMLVFTNKKDLALEQ